MKPQKDRFKRKRKPQPSASGPRTDWGDVAQWYDELVGDEGSEYHRKVVFPGVLRLLAPRPAERMLDVACGQGAFCRLLHDRQVRVTGVDAAGELIRLAKDRSDPTIDYRVVDARDLSSLGAGAFHAAVCILAIQNIHPIEPVLEGVAGRLEDGGRLVIVMTHPCFRGPKATSWGWDMAARAQYRRVDRYLLPRKEPIYTHPGAKPGQYTWTFHRPLHSYVRALVRNGLLVDALEEWPSHKVSDSGPRADAENLARREIPMFAALRAVKVGGRLAGRAGQEAPTADHEVSDDAPDPAGHPQADNNSGD